MNEKYSWCAPEVIRDLAQDKVGKELALQVVQALNNGQSILRNHRDYCGVGLTKNQAGEFEFCYVYDGYPMERIIGFDSEEKFVEFLSEQSDFSMSGAQEGPFLEKNDWSVNNQRITVASLKSLVGQ